MAEKNQTDTESLLNFERVIQGRKSVRGFLAKPIPKEELHKIFALAQRAPSNCNIQPWHVSVASGESCQKLREKLIAAVKEQTPPNPDYARIERFDGVFRQRQVETAVELYNNMGIARGDTEGRQWASMRNFEFFDAPHVAFISMPKLFNESVAIDVGMYAQTLMLSMTAHGVGSCAQASVSRYPDIIREHFGMDDDLAVLIGLAFGYEDKDVPANRTVVARANIEEEIVFLA